MSFALFSQEVYEEVFVINIEVPIRVFKSGTFVDYFIHNVIIPGDNLIIITPMKTYRLTSRALEFKSKEELAN